MEYINQMEPLFGPEERDALYQYMQEGGWLTEFKRTTEFEQRIADFTGSKHCIVVNNGTISLSLMAIASGIKAGDDVIVPNYTMIATANSIKMIGANPIFVDVEEDTLCMDIGCVKKSITPRTKAVMIVTANGRYPKATIESFKNFCSENNLLLLEDSAQSLGSKYPNGIHQGNVGIAGSFSFSAPKVISTGQGGAIITNDDNLAFNIRRLKDFGRSGGGNDIHDTIGFNFKFTEMQAVIGNEQMKKLPERIERKKEIMKLYKKLLQNVTEVRFFDQDLINTTPWFIDILAENRDKLSLFLHQTNIGTRKMYPPINKQVAYQVPGEHKVSNLVGEKGLWLPSSFQLSNDQIEFITSQIIKFYSKV